MLQHLELKNIDRLNDKVDKSILSHRHSSRHLCVPTENGGIFLGFHYCNINKPDENEEHIYIYADSVSFYLICDNRHITELFNKIPSDAPAFTALASFFQLLTEKDVDRLEKIEDEITGLEDRLITSKHCDTAMGSAIVRERRNLLKIKRYYEQLSIVTGDLLAAADRLTDRERSSLGTIDRRLHHLLNTVISLREYTTQVREAYQAQIDIEQNQIMKIFTVLTAVFSPLSLIVGWYGMNFNMPEYLWHSGYLYVISLSIVVLIICILFFKHKKWY